MHVRIGAAAGAKAIDQRVLARIEVHGKNLFYFFGEGPGAVVMHVHFGMSGAFKTLPRYCSTFLGCEPFPAQLPPMKAAKHEEMWCPQNE